MKVILQKNTLFTPMRKLALQQMNKKLLIVIIFISGFSTQ